MEKGFFHPDRGYWQTLDTPSADALARYPEGTVEVPIKPSQYAEWNGREWVLSDPPPPPVPSELTFAQLLIGLVAEKWITEAEGDAWLEGRIPASARGLIATLPRAQQFAAKARAARPSTVLRNDPLVIALATAQGRADDLDRFFTTYAQV